MRRVETERAVHLPRPSCPWCRAPVELAEEKRACEACMSWAHAECVESHGSCPACGAGVRGGEPSDASRARAQRTAPGPQVQNTALDLLLLLVGGLISFFVSFAVGVAILSGLAWVLGLEANTGTLAAVAALCGCAGGALLTQLLAAWLDRRRAALQGHRAGAKAAEP